MDFPWTVQWHITMKCQNRCKHCYMFDPTTYKLEQQRCLNLGQKKEVLAKLEKFGKEWGFSFPRFIIMGGDPLLASDIFPFLELLKERKKEIYMGGNPDCLNEKNLQKLQEIGISNFQISLDGLKKTHDQIRRPGSFKESVQAYAKLEQYGINSTTMTTLTPVNVEEFFELLDYVVFHTRSKGFSFDFVSRIGNGSKIEAAFDQKQIAELMDRYLNVKKEYQRKRTDFVFDEKPSFFRMLHWAKGELAISEGKETALFDGCQIGRKSFAILSDGTVLACRKFPLILGRLPEDDPAELLLGNETLKKFRRPQYWEYCGDCIGWNWCRGCPSICYGESKNPFWKPSSCFIDLIKKSNVVCFHKAISIETTFQEEAELIKKDPAYCFYNDWKAKTLNKKITKLLVLLFRQESEKKAFLRSPESWMKVWAPDFGEKEKVQLLYRFNQFLS